VDKNTVGQMIVQLRTNDYYDWRKIFDQTKDMRKAAGLSNERIFRGVHDGNDLVLVMDAADMAKARQYAVSSARKKVLAKSDVIGTPEVCFIDDVALTSG
jgi:hypothetical protein